MANVFRIEVEDVEFSGTQTGLGRWDFNISTTPPGVVYQMILHGIKRKIRDLTVNWHLRAEFVENGGKRVRAASDVEFADAEAYTKAYKEAVQELFSEWGKGNWGFSGGRTGDPVASEMMVILFKRAGVSGKEQAEKRKLGVNGLIEEILQTQLGAEEIAKLKMEGAVKRYGEQLRKDAEAIVAARAGADFDVSELLA